MTRPLPQATPKQAFAALLEYHRADQGVLGGDINQCAQAAGLSKEEGEMLFEEMCADLGEVPYLTEE